MTLAEFAESRGVNYNTISQYLWRHQDLRSLLTRDENGTLVVESGTEAWRRLDKKYPDPASVAVLTHHPDDLATIADLRRQLEDAARTAAHLSAANDRLSTATERLTAQLAIISPADPTPLLTMQKELAETKATADAAIAAQKVTEEKLAQAETAQASERTAREASEAALSDLRTKYGLLEAERDKAVSEASEAAERIARLKARGFWARLRNKES